MKNKDLRVGNYLQRVDGSIVSVKRLIKDDDDILVNETHGLFTLGYTALPIPLTEEILLNCGAKLHGIEYIIKASALPIKIRISYGIAYCEFGNVYLGDRIKFLHELQNLYHALTGQELKIEL